MFSGVLFSLAHRSQITLHLQYLLVIPHALFVSLFLSSINFVFPLASFHLGGWCGAACILTCFSITPNVHIDRNILYTYESTNITEYSQREIATNFSSRKLRVMNGIFFLFFVAVAAATAAAARKLCGDALNLTTRQTMK